jgi:protein tyrosine/serine phosphatase
MLKASFVAKFRRVVECLLTSKKSILAILILGSLGGFVYRASVFRPTRNFHAVEEGQFYRSAQLTSEELEDVVRQYGIKSVINLRGSQPGEPWFDAEKAMLVKLNVRMENLGFTSEHVPSRDDLVKYLDAIGSLPRPILVHCRAGSDRTGEASAIYVMEEMKRPREEAMAQLSFKYLHIPLFQPAKKYLINNYGGSQWARTSYDPCSPQFIDYASGYDCPQAKKNRSLGSILGYHSKD